MDHIQSHQQAAEKERKNDFYITKVLKNNLSSSSSSSTASNLHITAANRPAIPSHESSLMRKIDDAKMLYIQGDFVKAEKILLKILTSKDISYSAVIDAAQCLSEIYSFVSLSNSISDMTSLSDCLSSDNVPINNINNSSQTLISVQASTTTTSSENSTSMQGISNTEPVTVEIDNYRNKRKARFYIELIANMVSAIQSESNLGDDDDDTYATGPVVSKSAFARQVDQVTNKKRNSDDNDDDNALAHELSDTDLWKQAARMALSELNADDEALRIYQRILLKNPRDLEANIERNKLMLKVADSVGQTNQEKKISILNEVIQDCEDMLRIHPDSIELEFILAKSLAMKGQHEKAFAILLMYVQNVVSPSVCPRIARDIQILSHTKNIFSTSVDDVDNAETNKEARELRIAQGLLAVKEFCDIEMMEGRNHFNEALNIIDGVVHFLQTGECCNPHLLTSKNILKIQNQKQTLPLNIAIQHAICLIRLFRIKEAEPTLDILFQKTKQSENEVLELEVHIADALFATDIRYYHRSRVILEKVLQIKKKKLVSESPEQIHIKDIYQRLHKVYKTLSMQQKADEIQIVIDNQTKSKLMIDSEIHKLQQWLWPKFFTDYSRGILRKSSTLSHMHSKSDHPSIVSVPVEASSFSLGKTLNEYEKFIAVGQQYRVLRSRRMKKFRLDKINRKTELLSLELYGDPDDTIITAILEKAEEYLKDTANEGKTKYFLCMVSLFGDLIGDENIKLILEAVERKRSSKNRKKGPIPFERYKFSRFMDAFFLVSLIGEEQIVDMAEETAEILAEKFDLPEIGAMLAKDVMRKWRLQTSDVDESQTLAVDGSIITDDNEGTSSSKRRVRGKLVRWNNEEVPRRLHLTTFACSIIANKPYDAMADLKDYILQRSAVITSSSSSGRRLGGYFDGFDSGQRMKSGQSSVDVEEKAQMYLKHAYELLWAVFNELEYRGSSIWEADQFKAFERSLERVVKQFTHNHALKTLHGHRHLTSGMNPLRALVLYYQAFEAYPHDPLLNLCLSATYLQIACLRHHVQDKSGMILRVFAFLSEYSRYRMRGLSSSISLVDDIDNENGKHHNPLTSKELAYRSEIRYNFGRAFHQLGMTHFAIRYYESVLSQPDIVQSSSSSNPQAEKENERFKNFKAQAALNLASILSESNNIPMARSILKQHMVLKI